MIKGIHHVCMKCSTEEMYQEAISFYNDVLGMKVIRQWEHGIMLDTGNGLIELFDDVEDVLPQGAIRHFSLATDCIDVLVKRVRQAGYEITEDVHDVSIPSQPPFPVRIAFCIGPVGEEIEFFQER